MSNGSDDRTAAASPAGIQIERADPGARRRALVYLAIGVAIGAALFMFVESQAPAIQAWIEEDPRQTRFRLGVVTSAVAAAVAVPTLIFATYFWRLGGRVMQSNRFPPPGMRVVRDTVVWHGDSARRRGRVLQGMALVLGFIAGGVLTILWRLGSLFRSRSR